MAGEHRHDVGDDAAAVELAPRLGGHRQQLEHRAEAPLEDRRVERLLAREVVVEARGADADALGDVPQRRAFVAALGEQLGRGVEDRLGGATGASPLAKQGRRGGCDGRGSRGQGGSFATN
jgi:hypothetical protein